MQADLLALPTAMDGVFDYVWDYMCFSALDPLKRPAYADAMARALKPGGQYIALAFPVGNFTGGPPFAIHADAFLFMYRTRGLSLLYREQPTDSIERRRGCEELFVLQKTA
jgi:SAM-dependent methyltransferase